MKRYNLSEIMNRAHRFNKKGQYSWSECLKKSWKMAKFNVWMKEQAVINAEAEKQADAAKQAQIEQSQVRSILFHAELEAERIKANAKAKAERLQMEQEARKQGVSIEAYLNKVTYQMGYGRGSYCGD